MCRLERVYIRTCISGAAREGLQDVHLSLNSGVCLAMQEVVTLLDYIFLFGGIICAS